MFLVTVGLAAAGALCGAVLGALAIGFIGLVQDGPGGFLDASVLMPGAAAFGATVGVVLAPLAGWILMRHVPLGRAVSQTAIGTLLGVGIGYVMGPIGRLGVFWPILLGVLGFIAAAVRLRRTAASGVAAPRSRAA